MGLRKNSQIDTGSLRQTLRERTRSAQLSLALQRKCSEEVIQLLRSGKGAPTANLILLHNFLQENREEGGEVRTMEIQVPGRKNWSMGYSSKTTDNNPEYALLTGDQFHTVHSVTLQMGSYNYLFFTYFTSKSGDIICVGNRGGNGTAYPNTSIQYADGSIGEFLRALKESH